MKKIVLTFGIATSMLLAGCQQSATKPSVNASNLQIKESAAISATAYCPRERTIRRGSRGATVSKLQRMLNEYAGYHLLDVDGIFGPKTQEWVFSFQDGHGLVADGIVGRNTWRKLYQVTNRGC